jgi:hypothetical protein
MKGASDMNNNILKGPIRSSYFYQVGFMPSETGVSRILHFIPEVERTLIESLANQWSANDTEVKDKVNLWVERYLEYERKEGLGLN